MGSLAEVPFRTRLVSNRRRVLQLLQWVFAAAPGHPALRGICDYIAKHATSKFLVEGNLDTLERTGPGIWTDVVLKHALRNPPSKVGGLQPRGFPSSQACGFTSGVCAEPSM